jgi:peptidoglycan/LPS O-acetylase OafA/YrhL
VSQLTHRPDIDGLRAVAVLPVILFHFGFTFLPGGFVGVDVFFVISGYLITRLLVDDIEAGSFSFARFYERRARRLFPALFGVVVATIVLSPMLLSTSGTQESWASAIATLTSLSNVFFYSVSGYFETGSLTKPLLHTWSLSVEEQFYMVWPLLVLALMRLGGRRALLAGMGVMGVISLFAAQTLLKIDSSAAFFLTPFRVVEFTIGAVVLWFDRVGPNSGPSPVQSISLVLGLAAIIYSVLTFSETTAFPGLSVLIPAIGTALALWGGPSIHIGWILNNPLMRGIGLISYSAYLVHWPIAVYFDAYAFRAPNLTEQLAMLASTMVVSTIMYRYVEQPFRRPNPESRWTAPAFGLGCALLALAAIVPAAYGIYIG